MQILFKSIQTIYTEVDSFNLHDDQRKHRNLITNESIKFIFSRKKSQTITGNYFR